MCVCVCVMYVCVCVCVCVCACACVYWMPALFSLFCFNGMPCTSKSLVEGCRGGEAGGMLIVVLFVRHVSPLSAPPLPLANTQLKNTG